MHPFAVGTAWQTLSVTHQTDLPTPFNWGRSMEVRRLGADVAAPIRFPADNSEESNRIVLTPHQSPIQFKTIAGENSEPP
jgi:hypothetical protein